MPGKRGQRVGYCVFECVPLHPGLHWSPPPCLTPVAAVLPAVCYGSMRPRGRGVLRKPGTTSEVCTGEHSLPSRKPPVTQEESPAGGRKALPSCSPLPCRVTLHSFPVDSACFRGCPVRHSPGTGGPARVPTLTALLSPGPLPSFLPSLASFRPLCHSASTQGQVARE